MSVVDSMPSVKCADYTFSQLKSTVLNKDGDTVTATVAVEYLDSVTTNDADFAV